MTLNDQELIRLLRIFFIFIFRFYYYHWILILNPITILNHIL